MTIKQTFQCHPFHRKQILLAKKNIVLDTLLTLCYSMLRSVKLSPPPPSLLIVSNYDPELEANYKA